MVVKPKARFQEIRQGAVTIVVEWRTVKDHPGYEITREGVMRKYSTKKVLPSTTLGVTSFRYLVDGNKKSVSTAKLRNTAFPELGSW